MTHPVRRLHRFNGSGVATMMVSFKRSHQSRKDLGHPPNAVNQTKSLTISNKGREYLLPHMNIIVWTSSFSSFGRLTISAYFISHISLLFPLMLKKFVISTIHISFMHCVPHTIIYICIFHSTCTQYSYLCVYTNSFTSPASDHPCMISTHCFISVHHLPT